MVIVLVSIRTVLVMDSPSCLDIDLSIEPPTVVEHVTESPLFFVTLAVDVTLNSVPATVVCLSDVESQFGRFVYLLEISKSVV